MKNNLKVVSLFSGIGGFEQGLESSNLQAEVIFASEIDKFAKISYMINFPDHPLFDDITLIEEKEVPNHDILMAGFPCQAFSIAGKRAGFLDTRGTLFFDVARILKARRPKAVLLENVENLISHDKGKTIYIILKTLEEIGYTLDFTIINSSDVGVPQSRKRAYIIGLYQYPTEKFLFDASNSRINELKQKLNSQKFNSFNFFSKLSYNKTEKVIKDILDFQVDSKYFFNTDKIREFLNKIDIDKVSKKPKIIKLFDLPKEVHNDNERQRRVHSINGISPTVLARADTTKILIDADGQYKIRKLTPIENLRVQGFPEEFIENLRLASISDAQLYKQSGNAVSPPVIKEIFDYLDSLQLRWSEEKEFLYEDNLQG